MSINAADIIAFLGIIVTFIVAVWGMNKVKSEALEKEASAGLLYQQMATEGAKREKRLIQDVVKLSNEVQGLREIIDSRENVIMYLQSRIEELEKTNSSKDKRIEELEILTKDQATKINLLIAELESLRKEKGVRE